MSARRVLLEWVIIAVVVFTFCGGFLELGTQRALPGNEAEIFQSLDWVLSNSVREQHAFPLCNPYLNTGVPLEADPMLHAYNPLASIPVLLLGVLDGFKVALFLSFLAAALGMWWLGRVLGVGRLGRLWMALMFAFTGQAVARFFQGQYLFIKNADPQMTGAHTLGQIMLDYLSKDSWRPDAVKLLPREEFYAYTGIWPFLLVALLPLALWKRAANPGAYKRRPLVFLLLVLFLVWMWIDIRHMPWAGLYSHTTFLNQFRYPTRMLVYGACALVALAGVGLDMLWKATARRSTLREVSVPGLARWLVTRLGAIALLAFVLLSVSDLYVTNGALARTRDPYLPSYEIAGSLHQNQPGVYYVSNPNGFHGSLLSNDLRYIDAWYHFGDIRSFAGSVNQRVVQARPNYLILGNDRQPDGPDPILIQRFLTYTIWQYPHSLPFAFGVGDAQLKESAPGHELQSEDVTALDPQVPSPNRILVSADGSAGGTWW